jgi:hypothetical protein
MEQATLTTRTRTCYKCKTQKDIECFKKNKRERLGHSYQCKECDRNYRSSLKITVKQLNLLIGSKLPGRYLTITKDLGVRKLSYGTTRFVSVQCDCGRVKDIPFGDLRQSKSCGSKDCIHSANAIQAAASILYKDDENGFFVKGRAWEGFKRGAREREIDFNLSLEEVGSKFKQQNGKCFLTGVSLDPGKDISSSNERTWSLDRINSDGAYEINNIVFLHKFINILKNKFDNETIIQVANAIARNHPREQPDDKELSEIMTKALKLSDSDCENCEKSDE